MHRRGFRGKYLGAMPHQTEAPNGDRRGRENRGECGGVGGMSSLLPTRGPGSVVSCPSGVRSEAQAGSPFWHILKATEGSFLHLYADINGGSKAELWGTIA